jgi:hypothetical protein
VFIDTPGLFWQLSEEASPEERARRRALDVLLRNKGRVDRLKDPMPAVSCIVSRAETEDLMVLYSLPTFAKGDVDAFLVGVARAHGLIKKVSYPVFIVASVTNYGSSLFFSSIIRVVTPTSPPPHVSSCATG